MDFDGEADALWSEIYTNIDDMEQSPIAAMLARSEPQMIRIAMLYALLDRSQLVRRVHLEAAKAVCDYTEASVRYIFGNQGVISGKASKLWTAMRNASDNSLDK